MRMQFLAIVIVFIVFIIIRMVAAKKKGAETQDKPPYYKKKTLLDEKEQVLFHRLIEAMPDHYVMAQVRLADIVGVKKSENWQSWFNKISRKSVDFVICNKSFVVLACIELDGKTHEQEDRQKADNTKDEALNAAGIPIVRINANALPPTNEIKTILENAVLPKPKLIATANN
jgi:very-short-patch-repair endonuclease